MNAAYVTDYLEKQFGHFTRSYPYEGSDPLAFPTSGFLWDNALARKKTFRNYGEFVKSAYEPKDATWTDLYADYTNGTAQGEDRRRRRTSGRSTPYTPPELPRLPAHDARTSTGRSCSSTS